MEKFGRSPLTYSSPGDPFFKRLVIQAVEYATGRRRLERLYLEVQGRELEPEQVWEAVLGQLELKLSYDSEKLLQCPQKGPLVFIANHPFGLLDGLIMGYMAAQVRPDFFVIVNEVLTRDEGLKKFLLPIDFRETAAAMRTNIETRQRSLELLKAGRALAIFPAGGVATAPRRFWLPARDLEWKRFTAKLIQMSRATVVPLYFHGQNSRLFQLASQLSLSLRLSFLLHEIHNKIGEEVRITIGNPIPFEELAHLKGRQELLDHLRETVFTLSGEQENSLLF